MVLTITSKQNGEDMMLAKVNLSLSGSVLWNRMQITACSSFYSSAPPEPANPSPPSLPGVVGGGGRLLIACTCVFDE